jgi:hypothetical protein
MKNVPEISRLIAKHSAQVSSKMRERLVKNDIKSRSGALYASLKLINRYDTDKVSIEYKGPFYAKYIDWNGHGKWTTLSGRKSKIPTLFLEPYRDFKNLMPQIKIAYRKWASGKIKEGTTLIKNIKII